MWFKAEGASEAEEMKFMNGRTSVGGTPEESRQTIQWNQSITITRGPELVGPIREVDGINWPSNVYCQYGQQF